MSHASYDTWVTSPPEYKSPPSGDATIYVERPVPVVGDPDEGWAELAVVVSFDEGAVYTAVLEEGGGEIALTVRETEVAEVDWSEKCAEEPDEPEWDADR